MEKFGGGKLICNQDLALERHLFGKPFQAGQALVHSLAAEDPVLLDKVVGITEVYTKKNEAILVKAQRGIGSVGP